MKKKYLATIFLFAYAMLFLPLQAQVTIGSDTPAAKPFSVLELVSNQKRGLRLPQMSTFDRDQMTETTEFKNLIDAEAKGLTIYNTTIDCVEYWDGSEWIPNCEYVKGKCVTPCDCDGDGFTDFNCYETGNAPANSDPDDNDPCVPAVEGLAYALYYEDGTAVKAADLIDTGTRLIVVVTWTGQYAVNNLSIDGGRNIFTGNSIPVMLSNVGENIVKIMVNNCPTQIVNVTINAVKCRPIRPNGITVCLPYMFDYQTAVFSAGVLSTATDGRPNSYEWFVNGVSVQKSVENTFRLRPRELSHIVLTADDLGNRVAEVTVSCTMSNACSVASVEYASPYSGSNKIIIVGAQQGVLSPIKVNRIDENGNSMAHVEMAHVNLGAENTTNNCDLFGHYFQWGRKADGHQFADSHRYPTDDNSSENGVVNTGALDENGQIKDTHAAYGKFIKQNEQDWSWRPITNMRTLWGNGTTDYDQAKTVNDPCPVGWKIPSIKQWISLYKKDWSDGTLSDATANTWEWISHSTSATGSYRGTLIKNVLFLPNGGSRSSSNASPSRKLINYWYWSSVPQTGSLDKYSFFLLIESNGAVKLSNNGARAEGMSVRCIRE